jgi:hypothetical protein
MERSIRRLSLKAAMVCCSFTVPPRSDVSNRRGIPGNNFGNTPRLVGRPKRIGFWRPETCQSVRPSDRLATPDRSSPKPPRFAYCLMLC